jgi:hypothetical protein
MSVNYYQTTLHHIRGLILFVVNLFLVRHILHFRGSFITFKISYRSLFGRCTRTSHVHIVGIVGRKVYLLPTDIGEDNAVA